MIKHIFLDLDGTLLDFHKAEAKALKKVLFILGIFPTPDKIKLYSRINNLQWKRLEKGEIEREEVIIGRFKIFFKEIGEDKNCLEARNLYEKYLSQGHYFIDGAEKLLDELSNKYCLYLATNGTKTVQQGRIKSAGIEKYFNHIFVSEDIGFNKPDKRFFDSCFKKIENFDKNQAVIIGDSLSSDILGGKNANIKTVWFNPLKAENDLNILPDKQVYSLCEIPDVLLEL